MNDSKNAVILLLSVIVLVQAAVLFYVFGRSERRPVRPVARREAPAPLPPVKEAQGPIVEKEEPAAPLQGKIVLILDDWGYNLRHRHFIVDNDFHVTLSILPFKPYSGIIAKLAYDKDKDVIVHLPMEPHDKENYGLEEKMLSGGMRSGDVIKLLDEAFVSVPFAKGISNHMGSKATEDAALMRTVMTYLKKRRLLFVDSLVTPESVCSGVARRVGICFTQRDVFIDNENDAAAIRARLEELAGKARADGVAVGIGHDRPLTVRVLEEEIPRLEREGFRFINVSEALREKT